MSDPKPNVAPRPKTAVDPVLRQKVQAARTALGMKDVNVSAALQAHQNFANLAAKNPNVPLSRLMGRLASNQAKSYYNLTSKIPSNQLDPSVSLSKFRNTLRAIKTADQAAAAAAKAANESVELLDKEQVSEMITNGNEQNPPAMIVLRRRGIRIFPDGRRVALYDNKQLGLAVTIPYKGNTFAPEVIPNVTTEGFDDYKQIAKELVKKHGKNVTMDHIEDLEKERDSRSSLDKDEVMQHVKKLTEAEQIQENLDALAKIAKSGKAGTIKFKDGTSTKVHPQVAGVVHQLHGALNPENKKKVENMIAHSAGQFDKIADFAVSKSQWKINNK